MNLNVSNSETVMLMIDELVDAVLKGTDLYQHKEQSVKEQHEVDDDVKMDELDAIVAEPHRSEGPLVNHCTLSIAPVKNEVDTIQENGDLFVDQDDCAESQLKEQNQKKQEEDKHVHDYETIREDSHMNEIMYGMSCLVIAVAFGAEMMSSIGT